MEKIDALTRELLARSQKVEKTITDYARSVWAGNELKAGELEKALQAEIIPLVLEGQVIIGDLTSAYFQECAQHLGLPLPAHALSASKVQAGLRGVDPATVYHRPFVEAYTALKKGRPLQIAKNLGELRLVKLIGADMTLARRISSSENLQHFSNHGIQYYKRVLSNSSRHCALCLIASTQRYRIQRKLLPIHPGCGCGQAPLPPGEDVPHVLDPDQLEQVHEAIDNAGFYSSRSGRDGDNYTKLLVESKHGELGEVFELKKNKSPRK